ncbi:SLAP domain-containing protein [Lactobacillus acetotolerans]|jgi:hypothetical protein|uniref:SLAP domain-containing protein n=1 Tax=Lactobacillus acetotolerans TaxID=1600 RepID=UPI00241E168B|nr:SLAP domain-containing protein [Lactobacillus acetotolerans]
MRLTKKIAIGAITALMAASSILFTQPLNSNAQAANISSGTIILTHNSYVYNNEGKRKRIYQGSKKPVLTVGAKFSYIGDKALDIDGKKYYHLGSLDTDDECALYVNGLTLAILYLNTKIEPYL